MPKEHYYIDADGLIDYGTYIGTYNNTSPKFGILDKLLAINKLSNIAYYYNNELCKHDYAIYYDKTDKVYQIYLAITCYGNVAIFKNKEDAQKVIDNPNFRNILDTIYK